MKTKRYSLFALLIFSIINTSLQAKVPKLNFLPLWKDGAPGAKGTETHDIPSVSVHLATPDDNTGAAVIVCPGGGYSILAIDHEGLQLCQWLNEVGINAFLLKYRLKTNGYQPEHAIQDGYRSVRWLRQNAEKYQIDPKRIGMLGFSAGGHLASTVGIGGDAGNNEASDPIEQQASRPNFLILAYTGFAGIPRERKGIIEPPKHNIDKHTPPCFIFHTDGDTRTRAVRAMQFYSILKENNVPAEIHVFGGYGPHGVGMANGDLTTGTWPDLARQWMRKMGFLTAKQRVGVKGKVMINGVPIDRGWITFTPIGSNAEPFATEYLRPKRKGAFDIKQEFGPTPGLHTVTIHHLSDALNPEPSVERAMIYNKSTPHGDDLVFEVKPSDNEFLVDIKTE